MTNTKRNRHRKLRKPVKVILSFLLIFTVTVGGTLAYLSTQTDEVVNTFTPSHVDCKVEEVFNGYTKSSIKVQNTSDIEAYIRIKLISYRVNDEGKQIGGLATIDDFNLGNGWFKYDGFYYHKTPVAPNDNDSTTYYDMTKNLLADETSITLKSYEVTTEDPDGGRQVIEVMAEAIQSKPNSAVEQAWVVSVNTDGTLVIPTTEGGN